jgi:hypothetical protein
MSMAALSKVDWLGSVQVAARVEVERRRARRNCVRDMVERGEMAIGIGEDGRDWLGDQTRRGREAKHI